MFRTSNNGSHIEIVANKGNPLVPRIIITPQTLMISLRIHWNTLFT